MDDSVGLLNFKLPNMVPHPSIMMIGKTGTGKSYIVRSIIHYYRNIIPAGMIISETEQLDPFFKYFFPDLYIHYEVSPALLRKILKRQSIMLKKNQRKKVQGLKVNAKAILIMDDCFAKRKQWCNDETVDSLLMNGRHYWITYVLTSQAPLGLRQEIRFNFNYIFLLAEISMITKKKLWENYAGIFPNFQSFDLVFKKCTNNFSAMVIDNRKQSGDIKDKIFWYKAPKVKFMFGDNKFRKIHDDYYDKEYMERKKDNNCDILGNIKKNPKIDIFKINN